MAELSVYEIELKVDTSDAVNSLKKLQRLARETVQDLKEVNSLTNGPKRWSKEELTDELITREGVNIERLDIVPSEHAKIIVQGLDNGYEKTVSSPARIFIVQD